MMELKTTKKFREIESEMIMHKNSIITVKEKCKRLVDFNKSTRLMIDDLDELISYTDRFGQSEQTSNLMGHYLDKINQISFMYFGKNLMEKNIDTSFGIVQSTENEQ